MFKSMIRLRTHALLGASMTVLLASCGGGGSGTDGISADSALSPELVSASVDQAALDAELEEKRRRGTLDADSGSSSSSSPDASALGREA